MAIVRLLMPDINPDINILTTTAMETLNQQGRLIILQSGANVAMPNVTETTYRKYCEIYPGKICLGDSPSHCGICIKIYKQTNINRKRVSHKS